MLLYLQNLWNLFVDMSFYIVIGLMFTGLLHAFVNKDVILKQIGKNTTSSVVKASIFGVPLPLCSCGVVPTAMFLGKSGASKGAVVSFLTSTPQTGVDSIIATYGMMGPLFAVYRAVAAFFSGIISGVVTNVLCKGDEVSYETAATSCGCCSHEPEVVEEAHHCCCSHEPEVVEEEHHCCCSHEPEVMEEEHHCCCSHEPEVMEEEHHCCCSHELEVVEEEHHCCCSHEPEVVEEEHHCCCSTTQTEMKTGLVAKLKDAVSYAFGDFLDEIALHFVVGLFIAALISTLLPASVLSGFSNPMVTMILMVVIGIPMYICSTASIPIAVSLMMKGVSPGGAFVFLFAGPVTNIASLTILISTLGKKVTAIYLSCVAVCAIGFGLVLDYLIDAVGYTGIDHLLHHSHTHETPLYMTVVAVVFGIWVVRSLIKNFIKKPSCNCG